MIIFIFRIFQPFPTFFGLKLGHNDISYFFHIFCYFFGILHYASGRNETELYFLFSIFFSLLHPILAWNETIMVIFHFLNFFAIFLEFSITRRVGTERNGTEQNNNFYFLPLSALSNLFWPEIKPYWHFLIFLIYLLFFSNFLLRARRVGTEQNDNFYFLPLSALSNLFWLKIKPLWHFLIFLIYLLFFSNFLLRVG